MGMDRKRYPANWKEIVAGIFHRSGGRCECDGECGLHHDRRCVERHKTKAKWAKGMVVLTTAHLGVLKADGSKGDPHDKMDCRPENLKSMCNRCHLRYDRYEHMKNAKRTRIAKQQAGTPPLFEL